MYKNNYKRRQYGGQRHGGGSRRIRTFDPSSIVENLKKIDAPKIEDEVYVPKNSFSDFSLEAVVKQNIFARGYKTPTPIQDQTIAHILEGRDVVGIANTGTGKTAAFLIPLINKVIKNKNERVLIIAPTRELAVQIQRELTMFTKNLGIYSVICIGGVSINGQINSLRGNPHFVIGTPGRLMDLYNQHKIYFDSYRSIVLDEVDRMLDMGFIRDVEKIITKLPVKRQSLFFSATITDSVQRVMGRFIYNPVTVSVKKKDNLASIRQDVMQVNGKPKTLMLMDLLDQREFEKVLVFGRTKHGIEKLTRDLVRMGVRVAAIHGNKTQNQRQRALDQFSNGSVNVLVATDVASRGLDIRGVTHVINYDLPESYEDYIHRIGRTGRADKTGTAITFVG